MLQYQNIAILCNSIAILYYWNHPCLHFNLGMGTIIRFLGENCNRKYREINKKFNILKELGCNEQIRSSNREF